MDDQRDDREGCGIRFRKQRIAWSVVCTIACVLLIAVWRMEGEAYVRGYFPGIPQFGVSSYRIGDNRWHDTVSAYVMFGLHSQDDSEWKVGRSFFSGEPPERFTIRILVERWELIVDAPHWFLVLFCIRWQQFRGRLLFSGFGNSASAPC